MKIKTHPSRGNGLGAAGPGGLGRARHRRPGQHPLLAGGLDPEPLSLGRHQGRACRLAGARAARPLRRDRRCWCPTSSTRSPPSRTAASREDLTSITWKLKEGLLWSDGTPVTAEDAVFTAAYCMDAAAGCAWRANYDGVENVEAVDPQTIKITFAVPKPFPYGPLRRRAVAAAAEGAVQDCMGAAAAGCIGAELQPNRHRPLRGQGVPRQRRGAVRGQPELPRPGQARLRHGAAQGRRRCGVVGARGARDRRVRLCLEPPGRARGAASRWRPAARAR